MGDRRSTAGFDVTDLGDLSQEDESEERGACNLVGVSAESDLAVPAALPT